MATIDGVPIASEIYEAAVESWETDFKKTATAEDRAFIRERIIDEELIIKRGLDLGFIETDPVVRGTITQRMLERIIDEASVREASDEELRAWYDQNADLFTGPPQAHVRVTTYDNCPEGEPFGEGRALDYVPDRLLAIAKLREYLGSTIAARASEADTGSRWIHETGQNSCWTVYVVDRKKPPAPPYAGVQETVRYAWARERDDVAFADHLMLLRDLYDVEVNSDLD